MIPETPHKRLIREKTYTGLFPSWKYAEPIGYDCILERNAIAILEADAGIADYVLIEDIDQDLKDLKVRSIIKIEARDCSKKLLCLAYIDHLTPQLAVAVRRLVPRSEDYSVEMWTPATLSQDHRVATATSLILGATKRADHDVRTDVLAAFRAASEVSLNGLIGRADDRQARRAQVYALILEGTLELRESGARLDDGSLVMIAAAAKEAGDAGNAMWDAAA